MQFVQIEYSAYRRAQGADLAGLAMGTDPERGLRVLAGEARVIEVRPWCNGDHLDELIVDPDALARARGAVLADPRRVLVALVDGRVTAATVGSYTALGVRISDVHGESADALVAVFVELRRRLAGQRFEVLTDATPGPALIAALQAAELVAIEERVEVARELGDVLPIEKPAGIRVDPYVPSRRADLIAVLDRVVPAAEREHVSVADRADIVLDLARRADGIDNAGWHAAYLGDELAGVCLAQLLLDRGEGTVLYIGITESARRRGIATYLHREALRWLRLAGARRYVDVTTVGNTAMRQVFARAGCVERRTSTLWLRRRRASSARVTSVVALERHLRMLDHDVEVRDPSGWLTLPVAAGPAEATLDLIWLRDLGLLHVVRTFPFEFEERLVARVQRATAIANARLDVPGFIFDAPTRTMRFQLPLLLDDDGSISTVSIRRAMTLAVRTSAQTWAWWCRAFPQPGTTLPAGPPVGELLWPE